jgi:hypothetical protein
MRHKQEFFKLLFSDENIGIDLGNVEIKFSKKLKPQWSCSLKDFSAEYLVFYSELSYSWYFLKRSNLPAIKHHKKTNINSDKYHFNFALSYAVKWAYFVSNDIDLVMNEFEKIVENPSKYLNWIEDLEE